MLNKRKYTTFDSQFQPMEKCSRGMNSEYFIPSETWTTFQYWKVKSTEEWIEQELSIPLLMDNLMHF